MMRRSFASVAALAVAGGLAAFASGGQSTAQPMEQQLKQVNDRASSSPAKSNRGAPATQAVAQTFNGGYGSRGSSRRRGPGWTQAHVKRMARKSRNVARNRRAHRG